MLKDIQGMYFDFFGTLINKDKALNIVWSRIAKKHGININPDDNRIREGRKKQNKEFQKLTLGSKPNIHFDLSREDWAKLNSIVLVAMGIKASVSPSLIEEEFQYFFREERDFQLNPGCRETLEKIYSKGIKLGILSNASKRIKTDLEKFEILEFFDIFILAYDLSLNKSQIEVYERAFMAMNIENPEKIVHVGDDLIMDVRMAGQIGMVPILLDPINEYPPHEYDLRDVIVIKDLPEILKYLK